MNAFIFKMEPALVRMVSKGGEVGFAIPLKDGRVRTPRFSLDGGIAAMMNAAFVAQEKRERDKEELRDFTI
ncbi:MAG TPA: hypothetical protein VGF77_10550 [Allosphingosinicella sp.]